jgi:hypothetical protein
VTGAAKPGESTVRLGAVSLMQYAEMLTGAPAATELGVTVMYGGSVAFAVPVSSTNAVPAATAAATNATPPLSRLIVIANSLHNPVPYRTVRRRRSHRRGCR